MLRVGLYLTLILNLSFQFGCSNRAKSESSMPSHPASENCRTYGAPANFNNQRIAAFQQMVTGQIQALKSIPTTQKSTSLLASLEALRRRITYPFLQPELSPQIVTQIIRREATNLMTILETQAPRTPNTINTMEFLNQNFLTNLENQDEWNCSEKIHASSTDAESSLDSLEEIEVEKEEPPEGKNAP